MLRNKSLFISVILFFPFFLIPFVRAEGTIQVKQGRLVRLVVKPGLDVTSVEGVFKGEPIPYFEIKPGEFVSILGIDMDQPVGKIPFLSIWKIKDKIFEQQDIIEVQGANFGLQELTLPKKKVDLDAPTLKRVRQEKGLMRAAFAESINQKLWQGSFLAPVKGKRQGTFGRRRLINGQPKRSHTGEDISAPTGTPIIAPNHGKVVLVGHFFFNGRSVVIDHGLGLMSMYFHLSAVDVKKGMMVKAGDQIGLVGKSGRVTGPHLHWGMRLNNAKIDPYALVDTKFD